MSSLIKNELIKLSKRKKILISIILMICFSAIIILISNVSENQTNTGYYKRVLESQKETLKEELKKTKDQAKKQKIEVQIKSIENQIILLDINKNKNWKDTVKEQINAFEERKKLALDISYEDSKEYYNSQIKKLKYLLEHNINPNDENKVNGSTLFVIFLQLMGGFFIPIIVIVIASDIISNEFSSKTIRLLASKPISKKNIVISKFIAATIVCLAVIVGIELLIYFIFGIIKGFGNLNFPLTVGTKYKIIANNAVPIYESSQIIPYITAIIVGILIQMLY
ncbi:ABC transporter permease subunit, partial [Caldicellulosiruptoraceae bacterium PP1]